MYPALWSQALNNSSATFDFSAVLRRSRAGENVSAYDGGIPQLQEEVDLNSGVPVVIELGASLPSPPPMLTQVCPITLV